MTYNLILTLCIMLNCYIDNTTFYPTSTNWASQTNHTGYPSSLTDPSSSTRLQQTEYYGTQTIRIRANMFKNTATFNINTYLPTINNTSSFGDMWEGFGNSSTFCRPQKAPANGDTPPGGNKDPNEKPAPIGDNPMEICLIIFIGYLIKNAKRVLKLKDYQQDARY